MTLLKILEFLKNYYLTGSGSTAYKYGITVGLQLEEAQTKIQELDNKITDINLKEITNRIDKNLTLGDKYMNGFVFNVDIITYLIFLNTYTIPLELFGLLNRQLNVQNTKYLIFLIDKFGNIIKDNKICYITPVVLKEFEIFEQKLSPTTKPIILLSSPKTEFVTLLTSKTTSPKHKFETFIHQFISLSEPIGQSILYWSSTSLYRTSVCIH